MSEKRKDSKGRVLKDGESQQANGTYDYRYTDIHKKRRCIYAKSLTELRKKEDELRRDMADGIDYAAGDMTVAELVDRYMNLKRGLKQNSLRSYGSAVKRIHADPFGQKPIKTVKLSDAKGWFVFLHDSGIKQNTIGVLQSVVRPAFEMAVDDDIIRKNPAKFSISDYGRQAEERIALTVLQQEKMLEFVKNNQVYNSYYPMLRIMLGTGVRCGELIGLTWEDVDVRTKAVSIDHQLIYKDLGDGYKFHISTPKTDSGIRTIPMTSDVQRAFEEQKKLNFMLQKGKDVEIDGYKGFIFMAKSGRPLMPSAINNILYNIVDAYNKKEVQIAKTEHRNAELLPKVSAHIMRHTACTRMAEKRMDVKVLQYIMGHAHIDVTMDVYNHVSEMSRIESEITRLESVAIS